VQVRLYTPDDPSDPLDLRHGLVVRYAINIHKLDEMSSFLLGRF
jgi:hypothetical protein